MTDWLFDGLDDDPPPPPSPPPSPPPYKILRVIPKPKNVILFGETGAGKSAVINLIAGAEVAATSTDARACTLQATKYNLTLAREPPDPVMTLNIWDTIGLEEPDEDPLKAIENAHALITELHSAGGVDLLLFCIRAGRITVAMQRHYRLFFEILCAKHVPLAIAVTHLENAKVMEDWWVRNQQVFTTYGMSSVAHACITAAPVELKMYASKRTASQATLEDMLRKALSGPRPAYVQDIRSWFVSLMEMVLAFCTRGIVGSLKKKVLVKRLEMRCAFPRKTAQKLAEMMLNPRRG